MHRTKSCSTNKYTYSRSATAVSELTYTDNRLRDWLYWQRDPDNKSSWTKVYAIIDGAILYLYPCCTAKTIPLLYISVYSAEFSGDRHVQVVDPYKETLDFYVYDPNKAPIWRLRFQSAIVLTQSYLTMQCLHADQLPRTSLYRGSLAELRKEEQKIEKRKCFAKKAIHLFKI